MRKETLSNGNNHVKFIAAVVVGEWWSLVYATRAPEGSHKPTGWRLRPGVSTNPDHYFSLQVNTGVNATTTLQTLSIYTNDFYA